MEATLKEKQKQECIARMEMLHIMPKVIGDFKRSGKIYYSERQNSFFNATLYWLKNEPEYAKVVKDFEEEYGAMVYHAQLTHLTFGDCLSLLYVSKNEEEWEYDKNNLKENSAMAYVKNLTDDDCSEFGYIGIKSSLGGVTRTY